MKYQLDQVVIVNGQECKVYDYHMRYGEYTVIFPDGRREYNIKESDISPAQ